MGFPGRAPSRTSVPQRSGIGSTISRAFGVTSSGRVTRRRSHHRKIHRGGGSTAGARLARELMRKNEQLMDKMIIMMASQRGH